MTSNPPEAGDLVLERQLKTLWGASAMPFAAAVSQPFWTPSLELLRKRLQQLVGVRACGLVHGLNGVGKSVLIQNLLHDLSPKAYRSCVVAHSSLAGSDLLRYLVHLIGKTPLFRRSDNIVLLQRSWQELAPQWPVLVLEEAQNLNTAALEEVRLLASSTQDTQAPFSLLLVGDDNLLPRLSLGINRPLLSRLGFCLEIKEWERSETQSYVEARLREVAIQSNPFEPAAMELLMQIANGLPRIVNHLAQRSMEEAATQNQRTITAQHVQTALDRLPWLVRLGRQ